MGSLLRAVMCVPQMLGEGGGSWIYSLVIADDAIQTAGNWQMLAEDTVQRRDVVQ